MTEPAFDKKTLELLEKQSSVNLKIVEHFNQKFWLDYIKKHYGKIKSFRSAKLLGKEISISFYDLVNDNAFYVNESNMCYYYYQNKYDRSPLSQTLFYADIDVLDTKSQVDKYFIMIAKTLEELEK